MNIGRKIAELENDLETYRAIQIVSEKWKFILKNCNKSEVKHHIHMMLVEMGYSDDEIVKIIK